MGFLRESDITRCCHQILWKPSDIAQGHLFLTLPCPPGYGLAAWVTVNRGSRAVVTAALVHVPAAVLSSSPSHSFNPQRWVRVIPILQVNKPMQEGQQLAGSPAASKGELGSERRKSGF